MAFVENLTSASAVDASIKLAFDQSFIVAHTQENTMDQVVEYKAQIGAQSISFPRFGAMAVDTSELSEVNDVTPAALEDSKVILTPKFYGAAIVTTELASLQSGGVVDLAAAKTVGVHMARKRDILALAALNAGTNVIAPDANLSGTVLNTMYNKLARANVPTVGGAYIMVAHDDTIADLRDETGAGSWMDVNKYTNPETALRNEVGMYKGFRVVRNNHATITGAGAEAVYNVHFLGANALGLATSAEPQLVVKVDGLLDQFASFGWKGTFAYGIIEPSASWIAKVKSSRAV